MGDTVTFRGATLTRYDARRTEAGRYVRMYVTAELTAPVIEAMGWTDPGPSSSETKLKGELAATHLVMTPNDKKLRDHELRIDINSVRAFKLVSITKDEVTKRELRFVIRSPVADAVALVDAFFITVREYESALKVSYSKQEALEMSNDASTGAPACVSCENNIALDDSQKKHVNGVKCTRKVQQMPLGEKSVPAVQ